PRSQRPRCTARVWNCGAGSPCLGCWFYSSSGGGITRERCEASEKLVGNKFKVELRAISADSLTVRASAGKKAKDEAALLDQATKQLLKAVKNKMLKKQGRVDYGKLRKDGYSERFLDKLENA